MITTKVSMQQKASRASQVRKLNETQRNLTKLNKTQRNSLNETQGNSTTLYETQQNSMKLNKTQWNSTNSHNMSKHTHVWRGLCLIFCHILYVISGILPWQFRMRKSCTSFRIWSGFTNAKVACSSSGRRHLPPTPISNPLTPLPSDPTCIHNKSKMHTFTLYFQSDLKSYRYEYDKSILLL